MDEWVYAHTVRAPKGRHIHNAGRVIEASQGQMMRNRQSHEEVYAIEELRREESTWRLEWLVVFERSGRE